MRYVLTGGEVNDVTQADRLLRGLRGRAVVGDRAYDSDALLASIAAQDMAAVVPFRRNRKVQRPLDAEAYAQRNVIERLFDRLVSCSLGRAGAGPSGQEAHFAHKRLCVGAPNWALQAFRRVATRYDRTASSYGAVVALASALVVLSGWTA